MPPARSRLRGGRGAAVRRLLLGGQDPIQDTRTKPMRMDEVLQRIQGEYVEMPGLRLTVAQAQRLWGLERDLCDALLGALVDAKFLFKTRD